MRPILQQNATLSLYRALLRAARCAALTESNRYSLEAAVRSGIVRHDAASRAATLLQQKAHQGALEREVRTAFRAGQREPAAS